MSKPMFSTRALALCGSIVVLLVVGSMLLAAHNQPVSTKSSTTKTVASKSSTKRTGTPLRTTDKTTNLTTSNTSAADKQVNAATKAQPVTDACSLLTLSIAQQLLGSSTKASTPSDTSTLQATGTSVSACAYVSGSNSVQLVIRKPSSSVGTSENDVAFGSDKPANAVAVQGYGQSAYWDPSKDTFNVLGNNNWYIISRSSNTQAGAEAAANLLTSGF